MHGFAETLTIARELKPIATSAATIGTMTWFLASIFLISGIAKIRYPEQAALAIVNFGGGRHVRPALGLALGIAELLLAIAIMSTIVLPASIRWVPTSLSAITLWVFNYLIARSFLSGDHIVCFCFGEWGAALSLWSLARTCALAVIGSWAAFNEQYTAQNSTNSEILMELIIAVSILGIIGLSRQISTVAVSGSLLNSHEAYGNQAMAD